MRTDIPEGKTNDCILVVEDEPELREILSELLSRSSFQVKTATNADEALVMMTRHRVVAILTDIQMPGMSGLDFLRCLRERDSDVPVVFLSAHASQENLQEALRLGAIDFIDKPFDGGRLLDTMIDAAHYGRSMVEIHRDMKEFGKFGSQLLRRLQEAERSIRSGRTKSSSKL